MKKIIAKIKKHNCSLLWVAIDKESRMPEAYADNVKDIILFAKWLLFTKAYNNLITNKQATKEYEQMMNQYKEYKESLYIDLIETDSLLIMIAENWKSKISAD